MSESDTEQDRRWARTMGRAYSCAVAGSHGARVADSSARGSQLFVVAENTGSQVNKSSTAGEISMLSQKDLKKKSHVLTDRQTNMSDVSSPERHSGR